MLELTRQEKIVVVFLAGLALLGAGVKAYKKSSSKVELKLTPSKLDYKKFKDIDTKIEQWKVINVNRATAQDLTRLNGIGPKLAQHIIDYRTKIGHFKDKKELKNVPGIGPKKFDAVKDSIIVE